MNCFNIYLKNDVESNLFNLLMEKFSEALARNANKNSICNLYSDMVCTKNCDK